MAETKAKYTFRANAENEIYLSLIQEAWHSTLINQAVGLHMSDGALIDIADGTGVVDFWKKLDGHKKAEVLRRFGKEGTPEEKADPELWDVVLQGEPKDSYVMAAKYLKLHHLKYGTPWQASTEITGNKTREQQKQRSVERQIKKLQREWKKGRNGAV